MQMHSKCRIEFIGQGICFLFWSKTHMYMEIGKKNNCEMESSSICFLYLKKQY